MVHFATGLIRLSLSDIWTLKASADKTVPDHRALLYWVRQGAAKLIRNIDKNIFLSFHSKIYLTMVDGTVLYMVHLAIGLIRLYLSDISDIKSKCEQNSPIPECSTIHLYWSRQGPANDKNIFVISLQNLSYSMELLEELYSLLHDWWDYSCWMLASGMFYVHTKVWYNTVPLHIHQLL